MEADAGAPEHVQGALQAPQQPAAAAAQPAQDDGVGAAAGAAAAPAVAAAAAQSAPQGPRAATEGQQQDTPDYSYAPAEACDLVLKTSDGKRIGVHRLILLRSCGFLRALLEACQEQEVAVAETFVDLKQHLLDLLYSRAAQITPENVMKVFQLADKYMAGDIMEACRAVLVSAAFKIRTWQPEQQQGEGHADWLDVLALASKHGYKDLFQRAALLFVNEVGAAPDTAVAAADALISGKQQLAGLQRSHQLEMIMAVTHCMRRVQRRMAERVQAAKEEGQAAADKAAALEKKLEGQQRNYMRLLGAHNRLLNKCTEAGVDWRRGKQPGKRKKTEGAE